MVRRSTMCGPESLVARGSLLRAERLPWFPSLHLPEGEEPNQPTILAETAADSGNAEKLTKISRSPDWTPLASSGMCSFPYRPLQLSCTTARGASQSRQVQPEAPGVAEDRPRYSACRLNSTSHPATCTRRDQRAVSTQTSLWRR